MINNLIIVNNTSMFRETLFAANAIYTDLYANPDGSLPVDSNNINKIFYQSPYLKSTFSSYFIYFNYIFKLFYILSFTNVRILKIYLIFTRGFLTCSWLWGFFSKLIFLFSFAKFVGKNHRMLEKL